MKWTRLLVFLTQLAMSALMPLAVFVFLGFFLREKFSLGVWVIAVSSVLGLLSAFKGLRDCLKIMEKMASEDDKKQDTLSFNSHE